MQVSTQLRKYFELQRRECVIVNCAAAGVVCRWILSTIKGLPYTKRRRVRYMTACLRPLGGAARAFDRMGHGLTQGMVLAVLFGYNPAPSS